MFEKMSQQLLRTSGFGWSKIVSYTSFSYLWRPESNWRPETKPNTWRFPTVLRCGSPLFRCPWMCVRAVTSAWSTSLWSNVRVAGQNGRKVLTGTSHWSCNLAASHQVQGQVRFVLRRDLDTLKTVERRTNCKTVHYQNSKAVWLYLTLIEYRKSKRRRQATQLSSEDHVKKLMRFQHSSISIYWWKTIAQEVSISLFFISLCNKIQSCLHMLNSIYLYTHCFA